ncbi:MAG TPA: SRPBCC domain-containing protein [Longimicrobiaceae bacterium]|jgi:uncharacterized protein YndB with AHSA1/START domain|nr:SRPBCC domain-containing protein [Longimicrobiaceae bacterium]
MSVQETEVLTLRLERVIRADRERVFAAWTQPELLQRWSAPEGMTVGEGEADLRPGGRWRVVMLAADGTPHEAFGVYQVVDRPAKLVYTHAWLNGHGATASTPETMLTVEFLAEAGGTRVVLVQEGFATEGSRDGHDEGWTSCLDKLVAMFAGGAA